MKLAGLQKLTLLDYPGRVACTVFTAGCNLRCPFCHNSELVLPERRPYLLDEEEFFSFLTRRRGMLQGVCITGGEPTLQPDLPDFIQRPIEAERPSRLWPVRFRDILAQIFLRFS